MKKWLLKISVVLFSVVFLTAGAFAAEDPATDITESVLVGPGSIGISTNKNIMMSFGATARIIPVSETDFDFGMDDTVPDFGFLQGALPDDFFKAHVNESGAINYNYIRSEVKLHFNALPKDRKWSFYAALEFDRPLDNASADERGGKNFASSNFGLERLHGTYQLPGNMRFHAGFDIWGVDVIDGGGLVYGDDNPGFWLTGDYDNVSFSVGYFKLSENNYLDKSVLASSGYGFDDFGGKNDDRDLYGGYLTLTPAEGQKIQPFYVFDRIRDVPNGTLLEAFMDSAGALPYERATPDIDSHHMGAYYTGKFGPLELFAEGVYQFGKADDTRLNTLNPAFSNDYDISAYAFAGDVALDLKEQVGFGVKPHLGFTYTSGDDDPTDNNLEGYTGVTNAQRFSQYWGGENTIIGDTNFALGSVLYGYIPELYGNGTPVFTGGLENFAGAGNGRGDNPGMTMTSVGLTVTPKRFLILKSNVNSFWWNEDINVNSFVDPQAVTNVDDGYTGTEWDNEITLATSRQSFIKAHFSFFFPGEVVEDVTSALTSFRNPADGSVIPGKKSDDTAVRLGMEFIWNF